MTKTKKNVESLDDIRNEFMDSFQTSITKTNINVLDRALGGGLGQDDMIMIVAEAGIGKTTLALNISNELCKQGKTVFYLDSEGKTSEELLKSTGLYQENKLKDNFMYVKKSTFKDVEEILDRIIDTGQIQFIIIDSLSGIVPDEFIRSDKKKVSISTKNTMYSSKPLGLFMQKYNSIAKQKKICFILIQQFRNKLNMTPGAGAGGSIVKIAGPKACMYFPSQIIKLAPIKASSNAENEEKSTSNEKFKTITKSFGMGHSLEIEIMKTNKNNGNQKYPLYLIYGRGVSNVFNQIYDLINEGKITKEGSYYLLECEDKKVKLHGIKGLYDYIVEHQDIMQTSDI